MKRLHIVVFLLILSLGLIGYIHIPAVADDVYAEGAVLNPRLQYLRELAAEQTAEVAAYLSQLEGKLQALAGTDISPFEADRLNCRFALAVENALGAYYAYHDLRLPSHEAGLAVLVAEGFLPHMVPNAYFPNEYIPMKVLTVTHPEPTYEPGTIIYVPIVNSVGENGEKYVDPGWLILTGTITTMLGKWKKDCNIWPDFSLPENTVWIGYIGTEP